MDAYEDRLIKQSINLAMPIIRSPSPKYRKSLEMSGCCALWLSDDKCAVLKAPYQFCVAGCDEETRLSFVEKEQESADLLNTERLIYALLGEHEHILTPLEDSALGLLLPYMRNGNLRHFLQNSSELVTPLLQHLWSETVVEVLAYVHSRGVIQADVSARNFLVTDDLSLVLIDFSGSEVGGKECAVYPETRYLRIIDGKPAKMSIVTELFSVGSLLYEIQSMKRPYDDLEDDEVESRFDQNEYPSLDGLECAAVISDCWHGRFSSADEVLTAIRMSKTASKSSSTS